MLNLPTSFTVLRFFLAFVLALSYMTHGYTSVLFPVFVLGALTDWLDGYLARLLNQQTILGAFLDQFADKILVSTALIILVAVFRNAFVILPTLLIINREIVMSSLRHLAAEHQFSKVIEVNIIGKIKTVFQFLAIGCLFSYPFWLHVPIVVDVGILFLTVAAIFAWISLATYFYALYPLLKSK